MEYAKIKTILINFNLTKFGKFVGGGKFVSLNIKKKRYEQILFIDGDIACHCNKQPSKSVKSEEFEGQSAGDYNQCDFHCAKCNCSNH